MLRSRGLGLVRRLRACSDATTSARARTVCRGLSSESAPKGTETGSEAKVAWYDQPLEQPRTLYAKTWDPANNTGKPIAFSKTPAFHSKLTDPMVGTENNNLDLRFAISMIIFAMCVHVVFSEKPFGLDDSFLTKLPDEAQEMLERTIPKPKGSRESTLDN